MTRAAGLPSIGTRPPQPWVGAQAEHMTRVLRAQPGMEAMWWRADTSFTRRWQRSPRVRSRFKPPSPNSMPIRRCPLPFGDGVYNSITWSGPSRRLPSWEFAAIAPVIAPADGEASSCGGREASGTLEAHRA